MFLDTQKNSVQGESISMKNARLPSGCPVVACARCFLHLRDHDADLNTPMCVYFERKGTEGNMLLVLTWWLFFDSGLARLVFLN